ncbi:MAG: tetratricopeptide repeat protein [Acidobacteria bacterium]|nr:tetratricopeptide repeat protein [Acidobacteriota bacterium]
MKFRNLAVAATGALLLALSAFAQITAIEGDVKGEDGNPAVKATVKITRTDIKGNYKCQTNKKGHYFYNGLPLGMYNIAVEIDGKEMDGVNNVRTRLGDPIPVNFDLQKIAAARNAKAAQQQQQMSAGQALTKEQERSMTKEQKEAYEKALKDREAAMKKNKELNDAFNAGMTAAQAKDYDTAVTQFNKAAELDPKQLAVWSNLADAYVNLALKKTGPEFDATMAKGMEAYQKAIEIAPNDSGLHNNYALALAKAKKFPEMQSELEKAAQLDPTKAGQYYYNLGAVLVNNGQNDAAGAAFKKAIEIDPKHADSYYQYGIFLVGKAAIGADGKVTPVEGTVEAFQKYLELAPTGQFADQAKSMLASMDAKVDTSYRNPNAKTPAKKKK